MSPRVQFPERNAEIVRRRQAGELPHQIAEAMGVSRKAVIGVCNRAGLCGVEEGAQSRALKLRARRGADNPRGRAKLTPDDVRLARKLYVARHRELGTGGLARRFGVCQQVMWDAIFGKNWAHVQ